MGLVLLGKEERPKCVRNASKIASKMRGTPLGENTFWTIPILVFMGREKTINIKIFGGTPPLLDRYHPMDMFCMSRGHAPTTLVHRIAAFAFAFAMVISRCQWRHRCVVTLGKFLVVLYSKPLWRKENGSKGRRAMCAM